MTTNILRHPETEHITVHVLPDDIDVARLARLIRRWQDEASNASVLPRHYLDGVLAEIDALLARNAEGGA